MLPPPPPLNKVQVRMMPVGSCGGVVLYLLTTPIDDPVPQECASSCSSRRTERMAAAGDFVEYQVGRRFVCDGFTGTILYVGEVPPTDG